MSHSRAPTHKHTSTQTHRHTNAHIASAGSFTRPLVCSPDRPLALATQTLIKVTNAAHLINSRARRPAHGEHRYSSARAHTFARACKLSPRRRATRFGRAHFRFKSDQRTSCRRGRRWRRRRLLCVPSVDGGARTASARPPSGARAGRAAHLCPRTPLSGVCAGASAKTRRPLVSPVGALPASRARARAVIGLRLGQFGRFGRLPVRCLPSAVCCQPAPATQWERCAEQALFRRLSSRRALAKAIPLSPLAPVCSARARAPSRRRWRWRLASPNSGARQQPTNSLSSLLGFGAKVRLPPLPDWLLFTCRAP